MKRKLILGAIVALSLSLVACVSTDVDSVDFKSNVSNSLAQVNLVSNDILLDNLTTDELEMVVTAIDTIDEFTLFWGDGTNTVSPMDLNAWYVMLNRSYEVLDGVIELHWDDFTPVQQLSFKMINANLTILNTKYKAAVLQNNFEGAATQTLALATLALKLVAVP